MCMPGPCIIHRTEPRCLVIRALHQVRDKLQPESSLLLDAPVSSTGEAYQVRHDAISKVLRDGS